MEKQEKAVTFKGNSINLIGKKLKVGDKAPDFATINQGLEVIGIAKTPAKARLFSVVPSLDTPVCSIQTKKFEENIAALGDKVASYTVSLDLPFAQKRFCGAENIKNMQTLSDVRDQSFGKNWGVLIDGLPLPLLARAVFVIDKNVAVAYAEVVPEVTSEPKYDAALAALKQAAG